METIQQLTTQRFESNQGSLVEVIKVGMITRGLNTELTNNQEELVAHSKNFNLLVGNDAGTPVSMTDADSINYNVIDSAGGWNTHPAINQIQKEIDALDDRIALSKLRARPQVGVGLDYVFIDKRSGVDLEDNGKNAFMPMVSMSLPVFTRKYKTTGMGYGPLT